MATTVHDKFIVIKKDDLRHLSENLHTQLTLILSVIELGREDEGRKSNDYWVCNQDEPYADNVLQVILEGEDNKERELNNG